MAQKSQPESLSARPTNDVFFAALRQDRDLFVRKAFQTTNPGVALRENWHLGAITHHLRLVSEGKVRKLCINISPRTLKSYIVSVAYAAFELGHDPTKSIIVVHHSQKLASALSGLFRQIVTSDWYLAAFPNMKEAATKDTELIFRTSKGGGRIALTPEMGVTGLGADLVILDDPIDASNAYNQAACLKTNTWIDQVLSTRVNDPAKCRFILVQQRIGEYDTSAHIADRKEWTHLVLQARAEKTVEIPIGPGQTKIFRKGELLHPARLSAKFLEEQREQMGDAAFMAQYQQHPVPVGAGIIDVSLFNYCKSPPVHHLDYSFMSIDPASGSPDGSYTAVQLFRIRHGLLFMTQSFRGRLPHPKLVDMIFGVRKQQDIQGLVLEHAGYGVGICESVYERMEMEDRFHNYHVIKPRTSKPDRMFQAMLQVKEKNVFLPSDAPWKEAFLNEVKAFPGGEFDDQVDAFSQAVHFYRTRRQHWSSPTDDDRNSYLHLT